MRTMTIRNVPEELHARLKERAQRNRRSVNQQVIEDLSAVGGGESDADRTERARERARRDLIEIKEIRSRMRRFMTAQEIDAAIEEGRV